MTRSCVVAMSGPGARVAPWNTKMRRKSRIQGTLQGGRLRAKWRSVIGGCSVQRLVNSRGQRLEGKENIWRMVGYIEL